MKKNSISSIILVEKNKPVGIVTERDLVHRVLAMGRNPKTMIASDVCSKPVVVILEMADIETAVDVMTDYKIRRIVVLDKNDQVTGILTTDDIGYNLKSSSEELAMKYLMTINRSKARKS
jgi:CBS domain-containing protein